METAHASRNIIVLDTEDARTVNTVEMVDAHVYYDTHNQPDFFTITINGHAFIFTRGMAQSIGLMALAIMEGLHCGTGIFVANDLDKSSTQNGSGITDC